MVDFSVIVAIVIGAAQLSKKVGFNPELIPLLNVLMGMALSMLLLNEPTMLENVQQGLLIGLSASGFYDLCINTKKYQESI